jgi:signal transduction histidine kinase
MELRYDLHSRCAVRVSGGPVAARHAEAAPPDAPFVATARCGGAMGWLLSRAEPDELAIERFEREVERRTAHERERLARAGAAMTVDAVERLVHRLRTDVMTLQSSAELAFAGLLEPSEELTRELTRAGQEAQRRLTFARRTVSGLEPRARLEPEPIARTLEEELEGAGRRARVHAVLDEQAQALIPGAGWGFCAQLFAADARLTAFAIEPCPLGWRVIGGTQTGEPVDWTERAVGELVHAGHVIVAAGGAATAQRAQDGTLRIVVEVPAAPSEG